jgi:hypothetical protein
MKLSDHFDSKEFRCHGNDCGEPVVDLRLVENLEKLRGLLNADRKEGEPEHQLIVTSGWRCAYWNKAQGGQAGSQHLYNPHTGKPSRAADVYSPTRPVGEVYQASLALSGVGGFRGIGLAPPVAADAGKGRKGHPGYVHVDVRLSDSLARWGYDDGGRVVAIGSVLPRIGLEV